MLKKLAKSGIFIHSLLLAGLTLVFMITPQVNFSALQPPPAAAPVGVWLFELLSVYPLLLKPLAISLLVVISLIFNSILIRHDVSHRQSLFPAVLTLMFMLFTPDPLYLIITETCLLLLLVSMHNVMNIFGKQNPNFAILNASVAVAVASMIVPVMILFIIFIWFGLFTFRVNSWREWIISIFGLVLSYFYLFFLFFWNNNLEFILNIYNNFFQNLTISYSRPGMMEFISLGLLILCALIGLIRFLSDAGDKIISTRKKMWVAAQLAFAGIVVIVAAGDQYPAMLPMLFLPVAAALSYSVLNSRRTLFFDIIILLTIVTAILNRINI